MSWVQHGHPEAPRHDRPVVSGCPEAQGWKGCLPVRLDGDVCIVHTHTHTQLSLSTSCLPVKLLEHVRPQPLERKHLFVLQWTEPELLCRQRRHKADPVLHLPCERWPVSVFLGTVSAGRHALALRPGVAGSPVGVGTGKEPGRPRSGPSPSTSHQSSRHPGPPRKEKRRRLKFQGEA